MVKLKFSRGQTDKFREAFNLNLNEFTESMLSLQTGAPQFAMLRFDKYMEKYLGYSVEENGGQSLKEFIKKRYGQPAIEIIQELM